MSRKNVLMFTRCIGQGGTEKVIIQLSALLLQAGHRVIVCAARGEGTKKLEALGVRCVDIPDMQDKSPKTALTVMMTVRALIKTEKIDVIHTHHRMAAFYVRLMNCGKSVRFLNNIHNTFDDKRAFTRFAFGRAENIAVGESVLKNMREVYGLAPDRIRVIYNAVDMGEPEPFEDEKLASYREKGFFIVTGIGRINTQKGFEFFVRAADIVKKKRGDIKFVIAGDGVLRGQTEELVRSLNLQDTVYMAGFQKNIGGIIRESDLISLTSLWEGFPLTPIEAFSQGKTIVATAIPGTLEIVKHMENGYVVPPRDEEAFAKAVISLCDNRDVLRRLEDGARKTYDEKFSYEIFKRKYLELYER